MARRQNYKFRGLDLRSNVLQRQEGTARDLANVRLDGSGNLVKREEFEQVIVPRGIEFETGTFLDKLPFSTQIIGMIEDYSDDYVILVCYDDGLAGGLTEGLNLYYKYFQGSNTVEKIISQGINASVAEYGLYAPQIQLFKNLSYQVQNNILYLTGEVDPASPSAPLSPIMKFDGDNIAVSGVRKIGVNNDAGAAYFRVVTYTIDAQGRFTFSDYMDAMGTLGNPITVEFEGDLNPDKQAGRFAYATGAFIANATKSLPWNGSTAQRTIAYSPNLFDPRGVEIGQHLIWLEMEADPVDATSYGPRYYRVLVEDVNTAANEITLSEFQVFDGSGWYDASVDNPLTLDIQSGDAVSSLIYATYHSTTPTNGFTLEEVSTFEPIPATFTVSSNNANALTYLDFSGPIAIAFEDFYAEGFVKSVPPLCNGSIAIYRNTLITHDEEFIYVSDNYSGGNTEDFVPSDSYLIGNSSRGPITAVFANATFVAVFREKEAYYLSGNVITGNFRDLAYRSTRIGCASAAGIVDMAGSCYFPSLRSIHMAQPSGSMGEIGDQIEPLIIDNALGKYPNIRDAVSKIDFKREYILTYIPTSDAINGENIALLFSYFHNEWFLYNGLDMSGGLYVADNKVHYSDGTDIFIESTSRTSGVDAFFQSNYEILGDASVYKNFIKSKLYAIGMEEGEIEYSFHKNWDDTEELQSVKPQEYIETGDMFTVKEIPSSARNVYSLAITLKSLGTNPMLFNGYEYTYVPAQGDYDNTKRGK